MENSSAEITSPNEGETHAVEAVNIQPNSGETEPMDALMQTNNGGAQSAHVVMQRENVKTQQADELTLPITGEINTFGAESQLKNEDIELFYEEFQPNNGDMQAFHPGTHPLDVEIQSYDTEMQLHDGQIQPYDPEMQAQDGQIQAYHSERQEQDGQIQPYNPEMQAQDGQIQAYHSKIQAQDGQMQPYNPEMQAQDGQIQAYHSEIQAQDGQMQPYNPETQPSKWKKKKSMVWDHFTIVTVSPDRRRASCNRCKQTFAYSTGSKVAGTSHLKRHIARGTCTLPMENHEGNQGGLMTPRMTGVGSVSGKKRRRRPSSSPYFPFDHDHCRYEIAKMIIMHEYPLDMVEHPGFVSFVKNVQPQFNVGSFSTAQGDCIATFLTEKQKVMRLVGETPGRICVSLDLWSSNQTTCYVVITGHFIDSDWKLNRRILNVVMEQYPDSDTALGHAISTCLSEWGLHRKIFSITFNQKLNEAGFENLRAYLAVKNPHVLNGQLLIGNCIGRTLSCMAKDLLGAGQDVVKKIRDVVKYVKASDFHEWKFIDLKQKLQVPSEKNLLIDDQTKWSTTYDMLLAASELKEVFCCLDTIDPDYKKGPSMEIWKQVETLCTYLKVLYDAANSVTNTPNPSPITCFHEVWKINLELGRAVSSDDPFVVHLTKSLHEKISIYWKDCSLILAMAVVMDPRFKMKLVEFIFTKLYGQDAPTYVRIVDEGIHELFDEYVALPLPLAPSYAEDRNVRNNLRTDDHGETFLPDNGLADFDTYIMETTSQQMKSEIDQYLEESLLPRVQEVDVLSWWKQNCLKYPTLSRMARDILTTPMCTVTSETISDTIPRKMVAHRSTLLPVTVEALICAKDWLQSELSEVSYPPLKMEF